MRKQICALKLSLGVCNPLRTLPVCKLHRQKYFQDRVENFGELLKRDQEEKKKRQCWGYSFLEAQNPSGVLNPQEGVRKKHGLAILQEISPRKSEFKVVWKFVPRRNMKKLWDWKKHVFSPININTRKKKSVAVLRTFS